MNAKSDAVNSAVFDIIVAAMGEVGCNGPSPNLAHLLIWSEVLAQNTSNQAGF